MAFYDEQTGGLVTHWKSVAGITALVGSGDDARIFAHVARQSQGKPFVTFNLVDCEAYLNLAGASGAERTVVHIYCWAETLAGAEALAKQVRNNTRNMRGTYTGTTVNRVNCHAMDHGWKFRKEGSPEMDFYVRLIARFVHSES